MRFLVRFLNERLTVEPLDQPLDEFMRTPLWKARMSSLRSRHPTVADNLLAFPHNMTPADCQAVVDGLAKLERFGVETITDYTFERNVGAQIGMLKERATTGLAIKAHDPSVLARFEEFSHIVNEHTTRKLRDRQMWDAFFMSAMNSAANFSVPGSGKTASVLGAYAFLHAMGHVDRVVVISPKNAFSSWKDEWLACFGELDPCCCLCFDDARWTGVSTSAKRRELSLGYGKYNLITVNYEASSLIESIHDAVQDRSLLVFDEVHKVKQVGGKRATNALEVAKCSSYTIALTGTPIPNSYLDLYNLLHILYPNDYDWYFGFTPNSLKKPDDLTVARINEAIQPFFCRTNKHMLGVPEPREDEIIPIAASNEEAAVLRILRRELSSDPLALIIRILQLESDPSMLLDAIPAADLEWLADAGDVDAPQREILLDPPCFDPQVIDALGSAPSEKTLECAKLARTLCTEGKPVIIWCIFKQSMTSLTGILSAMGLRTRMICGEVPFVERNLILEDFKHGNVDVLITNPHTLAESVSLHMACHDAIYFECSYNLVHLLQSKDRINRLGLPEDQYTQYHFLQTVFPGADDEGWSLDRNIYQRLREKETAMLSAIDRGVLELGTTDKQDLEMIFGTLFDDA